MVKIDLAPFRHLYPFASRFQEVNGRRMHYVDEGAGEPVVMLHGNPTWSFYFRELIKSVSADRRAIAPDHIGCGLSDTPAPGDYPFRLIDRIDDLDRLLERIGVAARITLVLHDWGGMIGAAYALRHPERIGRLVVLNTAAFRKPAGKPLPPVLALIRKTAFFSGPAILRFNLFARGAILAAPAKPLPPAVRRGLLAPTRPRAGRTATLKFVLDIPLTERDPSFPIVRRVDEGLHALADKPMLICWGEKDFVFDRDYFREWRRRFPRAEAHLFPDAGHYVLEDVAEKITPLVHDFLGRHPLP
ncbi:MAG: alpha/beta fold hydrolase [Desulfobacterales bacterium]